MPIEFSEAEKKKLLILNPNLRNLLYPEPEPDPARDMELLLGSMARNAEIWAKLEAAYEGKEEALRAYVKAKEGPPLVTPVQVLGAFIFLLILIAIMQGV